MNTYWKRALATLVGASTIALTAACGAEVSGVAERGGSAAPVAASTSSEQNTDDQTTDEQTTEQTTDEPTTDEDSDGQSGEASATSVPEPATSPSGEESEDEGTADSGTEDGTTSQNGTGDEGTEDEGTADNGTVPAQPSSSEAPAPPRTPATATTKAPSAQYAYLKDYCTVFPESFMKGLKKDTTRKPDLSCVYMNPDSSKKYRGVTVSGGFSFSKEELDQSYNHDLAEVKIDGRAGFVWTNNTKSLYSASFNLPDEDGVGEISILVIVGDASISPAKMREQVLQLAALVSKKVPR